MLSLVAIFVLFPVYYMITLSLRSQSSLWTRSTLLPVDSNLDNYRAAFENTDFRATSLETLRQMVANGNGITLIPEIAVKNDDKINYIKIFNAPFRTIGIYYRKSSIKKSLIKEIIKIAKN